MSYFKAIMHQNRFPLGAGSAPDPAGRAYSLGKRGKGGRGAPTFMTKFTLLLRFDLVGFTTISVRSIPIEL